MFFATTRYSTFHLGIRLAAKRLTSPAELAAAAAQRRSPNLEPDTQLLPELGEHLRPDLSSPGPLEGPAPHGEPETLTRWIAQPRATPCTGAVDDRPAVGREHTAYERRLRSTPAAPDAGALRDVVTRQCPTLQ
jgi:hypothetical protein